MGSTAIGCEERGKLKRSAGRSVARIESVRFAWICLFTVVAMSRASLGWAAEKWTDRVDLFGYADFVLGDNRYASNTLGFDAYHLTMNMNIDVTDRWRVFTDVTYEHGTFLEAGEGFGEVSARYQIEGVAADWFSVKAGKFLTPFAEMNTYHDASPTYLSVVTPQALYGKKVIGLDSKNADVKDRLFAKESAGVWALGSVPLSEWLLLYNVYVANGRGGRDAYKVDDNDDKALGYKLELETPFDLKIGSSLYAERDGRSDSRILPIGVHAVYEWESLGVQGEYVRTGFTKTGENNYENVADAWYGQWAYRIRQVTPYYRYESFEDDEEWNREERTHVIGANVMINSKVYLKAEYNFLHRGDNLVQSQLSVAF